MESGPSYLGNTTQGVESCQWKTIGGVVRLRHAVWTQYARLRKRRRIAEPAQLTLGIGVQAGFHTLPSEKSKAIGSGRRTRGARYVDRLATLKRGTPDDAPTANQSIGSPTGIGEEAFPLAKRQLVAATQVDHLADVKARELVVTLDPEARNAWGTVTSQASTIEQIASVTPSLRPCVSSQEIQAVGKVFLHLCLKAMVCTVPFRGCIVRTPPKILEGNKLLGIKIRAIRIKLRQDLRDESN